jgi:hypothetical protein
MEKFFEIFICFVFVRFTWYSLIEGQAPKIVLGGKIDKFERTEMSGVPINKLIPWSYYVGTPVYF